MLYNRHISRRIYSKMEHAHRFNGSAANALSDDQRKRKLYRAIDRLFSDVHFATEQESIQPENIEKTRESFFRFLDEMNLPLARVCFEELLKEKTGEFAFRADGKVPNWYHEIRQCFYALSMMRGGLLREKDLQQYGGIEVLLGTILRHDSWEDLGKDRMTVYSPMERRLHLLQDQGRITNGQMDIYRNISIGIVNGMDLLTRKIPEVDDDGFVRKPNGKIKKNDRFDRQLNLYYDQILQSPLTALSKFFDGIEGMSTRVGVKSYSVHDDRVYTEERRGIYGRRALDAQAIERFPFLKKAIVAADGMLGTLLVSVETLNDYNEDRGQNPKYAKPIRIEQYGSLPSKGFHALPPGFDPICIMMERMRAKASLERNGHTGELNRRALMPSIGTLFPKTTIYTSPFLPEGPASGLTL